MKLSKPDWYEDLQCEPFVTNGFTKELRERIQLNIPRTATYRRRTALYFAGIFTVTAAVTTAGILLWPFSSPSVTIPTVETKPSLHSKKSILPFDPEYYTKMTLPDKELVQVGHEKRHVFTIDGIRFIYPYGNERTIATGEKILSSYEARQMPEPNLYVESIDGNRRPIIKDQATINQLQEEYLANHPKDNPMNIPNLTWSLDVAHNATPVNNGQQIVFQSMLVPNPQGLNYSNKASTIQMIDIDGSNHHIIYNSFSTILDTADKYVYVFAGVDEHLQYIIRIDATTGDTQQVATNRVFITVSEDGKYLLVQKSKPEKILIRTEYDDQGIGRHILLDKNEEAKLNDDLYLLNVETGEEKHVGIWPNTSPPMLIERPNK